MLWFMPGCLLLCALLCEPSGCLALCALQCEPPLWLAHSARLHSA